MGFAFHVVRAALLLVFLCALGEGAKVRLQSGTIKLSSKRPDGTVGDGEVNYEAAVVPHHVVLDDLPEVVGLRCFTDRLVIETTARIADTWTPGLLLHSRYKFGCTDEYGQPAPQYRRLANKEWLSDTSLSVMTTNATFYEFFEELRIQGRHESYNGEAGELARERHLYGVTPEEQMARRKQQKAVEPRVNVMSSRRKSTEANHTDFKLTSLSGDACNRMFTLLPGEEFDGQEIRHYSCYGNGRVSVRAMFGQGEDDGNNLEVYLATDNNCGNYIPTLYLRKERTDKMKNLHFDVSNIVIQSRVCFIVRNGNIEDDAPFAASFDVRYSAQGNTACPEYKCNTGECISNMQVCDGYQSCGGNSNDDEWNCKVEFRNPSDIERQYPAGTTYRVIWDPKRFDRNAWLVVLLYRDQIGTDPLLNTYNLKFGDQFLDIPLLDNWKGWQLYVVFMRKHEGSRDNFHSHESLRWGVHSGNTIYITSPKQETIVRPAMAVPIKWNRNNVAKYTDLRVELREESWVWGSSVYTDQNIGPITNANTHQDDLAFWIPHDFPVKYTRFFFRLRYDCTWWCTVVDTESFMIISTETGSWNLDENGKVKEAELEVWKMDCNGMLCPKTNRNRKELMSYPSDGDTLATNSSLAVRDDMALMDVTPDPMCWFCTHGREFKVTVKCKDCWYKYTYTATDFWFDWGIFVGINKLVIATNYTAEIDLAYMVEIEFKWEKEFSKEIVKKTPVPKLSFAYNVLGIAIGFGVFYKLEFVTGFEASAIGSITIGASVTSDGYGVMRYGNIVPESQKGVDVVVNRNFEWKKTELEIKGILEIFMAVKPTYSLEITGLGGLAIEYQKGLSYVNQIKFPAFPAYAKGTWPKAAIWHAGECTNRHYVEYFLAAGIRKIELQAWVGFKGPVGIELARTWRYEPPFAADFKLMGGLLSGCLWDAGDSKFVDIKFNENLLNTVVDTDDRREMWRMQLVKEMSAAVGCGLHRIDVPEFSKFTVNGGQTTVKLEIFPALNDAKDIMSQDAIVAKINTLVNTPKEGDMMLSLTKLIWRDLKCPKGKYVDSTNWVCVACIQACTSCVDGTNSCDGDSSCAKGFYRGGGKCLACHANCKECEDNTKRCLGVKESCAPANAWDPQAFECTACSVNGYYVDPGFNCRECYWLCAQCSDGSEGCNGAGSCKENAYWHDGQCRACHSACARCNSADDEDRCLGSTSCAKDALWDANQGKCVRCNFACKQCAAGVFDNRCNGAGSCADGYWWDAANSRCSACDPKCATCSDGSESCGAGHCPAYTYRDLDWVSLKCNPCHERCNLCRDGTSCWNEYSVGCRAPYSYHSQSNKCVIMNCASDQWFDNTFGVCKPCSPVCSSCTSDSSYCKGNDASCAPGHSFHTGQCRKCHAACKTCDNFSAYCRGNTASCADGYYYDPAFGATQNNAGFAICTNCNAACKTCTDATNSCAGPGSCAAKHYWDAATSKCLPCFAGCKTCTDNSESCEGKPSCAEGYRWAEEKCTPCHAACTQCYDGTESCAGVGTCKPGYYWNAELNKCTRCRVECKTCSDDNSLQCTSNHDCAEGYYYTNQCTKCDVSCARCNTQGSRCMQTETNACALHYFWYSATPNDFLSWRCTPCNAACKTCTDLTNKCGNSQAACADGYHFSIANGNCFTCTGNTFYDDPSNQCQTCHQACTTCSDGTSKCMGQASSCAAGFLWNEATQRCLRESCPAGQADDGTGNCVVACTVGTGTACKSCGLAQDVLKCAACNAGHTLQNGACQPCAAGTWNSDGLTCTACPTEAGNGVLPTTLTGATTVAEACHCAAGYTGTGDKCYACARGNYKPSAGAGPCISCVGLDMVAADFLGSVAVGTACSCAPGYEGSAATACTACTAGKYKPLAGDATCTACSGTGVVATDSVGSQFADFACQCGAGYEGDGVTCTKCAVGTFKASPGFASCVSCVGEGSVAATVEGAIDANTGCQCAIGYEKAGDSCFSCAPGTYKSTVGNAACTRCTGTGVGPGTTVGATTALEACTCAKGYAGTFDGTAASCQACTAGSYKAAGGSGTCTSCVATGVVATTVEGASSVATACECAAGYYGTAATACTICPAGKYAASKGSAECTACTGAGVVGTSTEGSTSATQACQCDKGYTGSGQSCQACVPGEYKDTVGSASCTSCVAADKSATTATASVSAAAACECAKGYEGTYPSCTACQAGNFKATTGDGSCTACSGAGVIGTAALGAVSAADGCQCDKGYTGTGTTCQACEVGKYKDAVGAALCTSCVATGVSATSATAALDAATACECAAGYSGTFPACTACEAGKYKEAAGTGTCTACSGVAVLSTTTLGAASVKEACQCDKGYFGAGLSCTVCPVDTFSATVGALQCTPCATGEETDDTTGQTSCVCKPGYFRQGSVCAPCAEDSFKAEAGDGICTPCGDGTATEGTGATQCLGCTALTLKAPEDVQLVDASTGITLTVTATVCGKDATAYAPQYTWTLVSQDPTTPALSVSLLSSAKTSSLTLPSNALAADTLYVFSLSASSATLPAAKVTVSVQTQAVPVVARLGPLPPTLSVSSPLVLDAAASLGALPGQPLLFTFSCRTTNGDCTGLELPTAATASSVTVPADTLSPGTYFFTVVVARGELESTAAAYSVLESKPAELSLRLLATPAATAVSHTRQQVELNSDSQISVQLAAVWPADGSFAFTCTGSPDPDELDIFPITSDTGSVSFMLNPAGDTYFTAPAYILKCSVTLDGVTSDAQVLDITVRQPPVVTLTATAADDVVTALSTVVLTAEADDVATVQFFYQSPLTGETVALSAASAVTSFAVRLPADTITILAAVRDVYGAAASVSYDLPFTIGAVDASEVAAQLEKELQESPSDGGDGGVTEGDKTEEAYATLRLVGAYAAVVASKTTPAEKQQASVQALQRLEAVVAQVPPKDVAGALHEVVLAGGLAGSALDKALDLVRSLVASLSNRDATIPLGTVNKATTVIADLIALFSSESASTASTRLRLQKRSVKAVEGGTVMQLNELFNGLVGTLTAPAAAATASARPQGSSLLLNTTGLVSSLTPINNPTTLTEVPISSAAATATFVLPTNPGVVGGYLVGLVLASPNPYRTVVAQTLLSAALLPVLESRTGELVTAAPTGGAVRLWATSLPGPNTVVACGFLGLTAGATAFTSYAVSGASGTGEYTCQLRAALGVYSLLAVPAPPVTLPPAPAPAPTAATTTSPFVGEDDQMRVGLAIGLGAGLPVLLVVVAAVWWCLARPLPVKNVETGNDVIVIYT